MTFEHVLVTGASSGLGRGLALHYARAGATVHALARRREELERLAADAGGRVRPVVADVADADRLAAAIEAAQAEAGGALDLVIANAGIGGASPARKLDWRKVKRLCDVNVTGACVTLAAALPAMVKRGRGTVVAMSSLAALRGMPGTAAYCASKAMLHTFMEGLRVDLHGSGVRAVTLYPGFVKTEMTAQNRFRMPFLMELDDAVRVMAAAIDRGDATFAFPRPLHLVMRAVAAVPRGLYEPLARRASAKS